MAITRYNKSIIGLMEMNKEGKWCLHEEVEEKLKARDELIEYYHKYAKDCNEDLMKQYEKYLKQLDKNFITGMLLLLSIGVNIAQALIG